MFVYFFIFLIILIIIFTIIIIIDYKPNNKYIRYSLSPIILYYNEKINKYNVACGFNYPSAIIGGFSKGIYGIDSLLGYISKEPIEGLTKPLYLFHDKEDEDFILTSDKKEYNKWLKKSHFKGICGHIFIKQLPSMLPLKQYYRPIFSNHFYSTNKGTNGWEFQKIIGYVSPGNIYNLAIQ